MLIEQTLHKIQSQRNTSTGMYTADLSEEVTRLLKLAVRQLKTDTELPKETRELILTRSVPLLQPQTFGLEDKWIPEWLAYVNAILQNLETFVPGTSPKERTIEGHMLTILQKQNAVAVIETPSRSRQGTMFCLEESGCVTCEHVVDHDSEAFTATDIKAKHPVSILIKDQDLDFAVCKTPLKMGELRPHKGGIAIGDKVYVVGFPNYRENDSIRVVETKVASARTIAGQSVYTLASGIVAGNSGGPVLTEDCRVLGICTRGSKSNDTQEQTEDHQMLPISTILDAYRTFSKSN